MSTVRERRVECNDPGRDEEGRAARPEVVLLALRPASGSLGRCGDAGRVSFVLSLREGDRPPDGAASCSIGMGCFGVTGEFSISNPPIPGCLPPLRSRSRGSPILVLPLSPPVERSTPRKSSAKDALTGLWRLLRCSGSVNNGYSSRVSGATDLVMGSGPSWT